MKKTIFSIAAATMIITSNANALFGTEATEFTLLATKAQLVLQYKKQLEEYAAEFASMKSLTQNIGQLSPNAWNKFSQDFQSIQKIVKASQGLTYTAEDWQNKFENMHSGYDLLLNKKNLDPQSIYKSLSEETRQTVKDNLKRLNMTQKEWDDDEATMQSLRKLSSSQTGMLTALEAASEITLHQTQTLKKLHETMMMEVNTQSQWIAAQQAKEDVARADFDRFNSRKANININNSQYAGGRQW